MLERLITTAKQKPEYLFYLAVAFLAASLALVLAIDVFNAFDSRTRWLEGAANRSFFWMHWFSEPVENPMQWFLLLLGIAVFAMGAGAAYQRQDSERFEFALLMSVALGVMFMEDAADPRRSLRHQVEQLVGEGSYGFAGTAVELIYFALIGALVLYVFFRFRKAFWSYEKVRRYMIRAYALYAVAVGSSFLGSAFRSVSTNYRDLYTVVGEFFMGLMFLDGGQKEQLYAVLDAHAQQTWGHPLAFYFMDRVWEESIELLGATCLAVAAICFFRATTEEVQKRE